VAELGAPSVVLAALLLSVERLCYVWAWKSPEAFRAVCASTPAAEPVDVLQALFVGFKVLQISVFLGWCVAYGDGRLWPPEADPGAVALGAACLGFGQALNLGVFYRLGKRGVFYGNRFGYETSWCRAFPFSLCDHPQYVGTLLSIWGFFLIMRFPAGDWFVIPAIETAYYTLGAHAEQ
jgi:phosphatidyl-N-methylethanolamine N-methyltransferase